MDARGPRASSSTTPWTYRFLRARATRSRAARPRSSRTSSPSECWGCRAHELRPLRRPARDPAHRARVPRRALHAGGGARDSRSRRARLHRRTGTRSSSSAGRARCPRSRRGSGSSSSRSSPRSSATRWRRRRCGAHWAARAAASGARGARRPSRCGTRTATATRERAVAVGRRSTGTKIAVPHADGADVLVVTAEGGRHFAVAGVRRDDRAGARAGPDAAARSRVRFDGAPARSSTGDASAAPGTRSR